MSFKEFAFLPFPCFALHYFTVAHRSQMNIPFFKFVLAKLYFFPVGIQPSPPYLVPELWPLCPVL